ncbi:MAG: glycosyltransferase family 4 protein, partial [Cytophagales bacterium]|nr:glycosyltransferase family 4 protein [Cytophagales bacterium]
MIWLIRYLYARLQQSIGLYFRNKKINRPNKPKCTVVAWNLSHNPVGRAFLFADFLKPEYDTKLVGPIFPQYGEKLWKPLRGYPINVESFIAKDFPDFWTQAEEFVDNQEPVDLVIICKPRLPSILIGLLIAKKNNAKVVLDIDDHELSFFENRTPLSAVELDKEDSVNLLSPHSESWTRYCESLIADFPTRTVSNITLQEKFGGTIIPHVRDELVFNPWLYNRRKMRKKYGYGRKDRVVLFLGTPRVHKGTMAIPEAIKKLNNPNYKVCLIGRVRGEKMKEQMDLEQYDFVQTIKDIKFNSLPRHLMIADLICLLQDVDSPVSKYQMPAKLSDALMMGIPVIATPVEPLKPFIDEG